MDETRRDQLYANLSMKKTKDLLEIWVNYNPNDWIDDVSGIVKKILLERLDSVPQQSTRSQVDQKLSHADKYYETGEFDNALVECDAAIQLSPDHAPSYNIRGLIFDKRGEFEKALGDYRKAIQLDRRCNEAWENIESLEKQLKEEYQNSPTKQHLELALKYATEGDQLKAEAEIELANLAMPDLGYAYNDRGVVYDMLEQFEMAMEDYRKAIQLDPDLKDARKNIKSLHDEVADDFEHSVTKNHLDLALEFAQDEEPEKAMVEIELAKQTMAGMDVAYNYMGMILEGLDKLQPAIEAYLEAVRLNPIFYNARENLGNARKKWEEEQYRLFPLKETDQDEEEIWNPDESQELDPSNRDNLAPGWVYLDEKAFVLSGWPGHRNRPGRSGYDPLDKDFEAYHILGIVIRKIFTFKMRTQNRLYLNLMILIVFVSLLPIFFLFFSESQYLLGVFMLLVIFSPYWVTGLTLLINVFLSVFRINMPEQDDSGSAFY